MGVPEDQKTCPVPFPFKRFVAFIQFAMATRALWSVVVALALVSQGHSFLVSLGRSVALSPRTRGLDAATDLTLEEKRVRKLKKDLKRIGELRLRNYLTLKTEQRVKVHSEPDVLAELETLLGDTDLEVVRSALQPGLAPLPRSKSWTYERSILRAKDKAAERRQLEASLGVRGKDVSVRKGDWRCECGSFCYGSKPACFACGAER